MYTLVRFDDGVYFICTRSRITSKDGRKCCVKYTDGGRYPAQIIASNPSRQYLENLQQTKISENTLSNKDTMIKSRDTPHGGLSNNKKQMSTRSRSRNTRNAMSNIDDSKIANNNFLNIEMASHDNLIEVADENKTFAVRGTNAAVNNSEERLTDPNITLNDPLIRSCYVYLDKNLDVALQTSDAVAQNISSLTNLFSNKTADGPYEKEDTAETPLGGDGTYDNTFVNIDVSRKPDIVTRYTPPSTSRISEKTVDSLSNTATSHTLPGKSLTLRETNMGEDNAESELEYQPAEASNLLEERYEGDNGEQSRPHSKTGSKKRESSKNFSKNYGTPTPARIIRDDTDMFVTASNKNNGAGKKSFCMYCKTMQSKFARHLEAVHQDIPEVKAFSALPKNTGERKKIIETIRKNCQFEFNTNDNLNNGELLVCRRPQAMLRRKACDFQVCHNCKGFFSKNNIRHHARGCFGYDGSKNRTLMVMGRKIVARIHELASERLISVCSVLREDNVARTIRYDRMLILYGNKLCRKYKQQHDGDQIRAHLRMLGRFLLALKVINEDIFEFATLYNPKYYEDVVSAINILGEFDRKSNTYKHPSTAYHLRSFVKKIGDLLVSDCIRRRDSVHKKKVEDFLALALRDMGIGVDKTVVELQTERKRHKQTEILFTKDGKKVATYLDNSRNELYQNLQDKSTALGDGEGDRIYNASEGSDEDENRRDDMRFNYDSPHFPELEFHRSRSQSAVPNRQQSNRTNSEVDHTSVSSHSKSTSEMESIPHGRKRKAPSETNTNSKVRKHSNQFQNTVSDWTIFNSANAESVMKISNKKRHNIDVVAKMDSPKPSDLNNRIHQSSRNGVDPYLTNGVRCSSFIRNTIGLTPIKYDSPIKSNGASRSTTEMINFVAHGEMDRSNTTDHRFDEKPVNERMKDAQAIDNLMTFTDMIVNGAQKTIKSDPESSISFVDIKIEPTFFEESRDETDANIFIKSEEQNELIIDDETALVNNRFANEKPVNEILKDAPTIDDFMTFTHMIMNGTDRVIKLDSATSVADDIKMDSSTFEETREGTGDNIAIKSEKQDELITEDETSSDIEDAWEMFLNNEESNDESTIEEDLDYYPSGVISADVSQLSTGDSFARAKEEELNPSLVSRGLQKNSRELHVPPSNIVGGINTKRHFCQFCKKLQTKYARHLFTAHSNVEAVKECLRYPKGNQRMRAIGKLRKEGDYLYNTHADVGSKILITCRRPQPKFKKSADDYVSCNNCMGFYSKRTLRIHYKNCKPAQNKGHQG